jgi:hypothetical protein
VSAGSLASSVEPEIISLFNLAAVTAFAPIFAAVTVASLGVPRSRTSPSI